MTWIGLAALTGCLTAAYLSQQGYPFLAGAAFGFTVLVVVYASSP